MNILGKFFLGTWVFLQLLSSASGQSVGIIPGDVKAMMRSYDKLIIRFGSPGPTTSLMYEIDGKWIPHCYVGKQNLLSPETLIENFCKAAGNLREPKVRLRGVERIVTFRDKTRKISQCFYFEGDGTRTIKDIDPESVSMGLHHLAQIDCQLDYGSVSYK